MLHGTNSKISDVSPCTDLTDLDIFHVALIVDHSDRSSLRSKRFRLVSEQRKTEERDSRFWLREK